VNANVSRIWNRPPLVRYAIAAFAIASLTSGCSPSNTYSNTTTQSTTDRGPDTSASALSSGSSGRHRHHRRHGRHAYSGAAFAGGAAAAGGAAVAAAARPAASGGGSYSCDVAQFLSYQSQFANGSLQGDREVDICGTVTRVLAEKDTRSGLHGYYDLQVAPGSIIEIVSDLGEMNAPAWPWVKVGDYSYVQGRYYYDSPSSQGVDWTHHGTSASWPTAGYVVVAGTQYQ
jgi:hypothetical protein